MMKNRKLQKAKEWYRQTSRRKVVSITVLIFMYATFCGIPNELSSTDKDRSLQIKQLNNDPSILSDTYSGEKDGWCCTNTPYILISDILETMPPVVAVSERNPPTHIQLCKEYIYRSEVEDTEESNGNESSSMATFRITEDESVCTDWEAPHYSVLSMFASSLVAAVGKDLGLRYKHNCRQHIQNMHNNPNLHYDYTPVQALLPDNLISKTDAEKVRPELINKLCKNCIWDYENIQELEFKSGVTHHCLVMPEIDIAQEIQDENDEIPLVSILSSIIDRMRHMADDWIVTTDHPKGETDTGVIIAVDEKSSFMNPKEYDKIIPEAVTTIQVFASASCGIAHVQEKSDCIEHGRILKRYFLRTRAQYGTKVRYDVVGSSAASFSRLIEGRITICPPGTVMCLLPALAKKAGKKAYIAEDQENAVTYHWFENHVLEERKNLRFQEVGYDAIPDDGYLDIISNVDTSPLEPEDEPNTEAGPVSEPAPAEEPETVVEYNGRIGDPTGGDLEYEPGTGAEPDPESESTSAVEEPQTAEITGRIGALNEGAQGDEHESLIQSES